MIDARTDPPFTALRIVRPADLRPPDARHLDVAVLDMNHGWPNIGHESLLQVLGEVARSLAPALERAGLRLRALSFDVRRGHVLPEPPGGRFSVYVGTGGPGQLDPRLNDGVSAESQGVREDPAWEAPLFRLFDAVLADREAALLGVCHTFGVMCRWAGIARASLRGLAKGGKSTGILENVLTAEALEHPWFRRFADRLPDGRRLRIVDSRWFDLIPEPGFGGYLPIGFETRGLGGPAGEALTMLEFARDADGMVPRVFGVNHHPEIVDRRRQMGILDRKLVAGEVTRDWYDERVEILTRTCPDEDSEARLRLTSEWTLIGPLRHHLERQARRGTATRGGG